MADLIQKLPEQVHAQASVGQEQVMACPRTVRRRICGKCSGMARTCSRGATSPVRRGSKASERAAPTEGSVDLINSETVLEGRSQRLEGEFVAIDQYGPGNRSM